MAEFSMQVILIAMSGGLSLVVSILIVTINKRDKRSEEREMQLVKLRAAESLYMDNLGTMSGCSARVIIGNIEDVQNLPRCMEDYEKSKSELIKVKGDMQAHFNIYN